MSIENIMINDWKQHGSYATHEYSVDTNSRKIVSCQTIIIKNISRTRYKSNETILRDLVVCSSTTNIARYHSCGFIDQKSSRS